MKVGRNNNSKFYYFIVSRHRYSFNQYINCNKLIILSNLTVTDWPTAAVYDVTLSYRGTFPQKESDLISGILPQSVCFHIRRYSAVSDIPVELTDIDSWLRDRWNEKDQRIGQLLAVEEGNKFDDEVVSRMPDKLRVYQGLSIAIWLVYIVLFVVVLCSYSAIYFLIVPVVIFYIYVGAKRGGFELLQAKYTSHSLKRH